MPKKLQRNRNMRNLPAKKIDHEEAVRMSIVNTQAVYWPRKEVLSLVKKLPSMPLGKTIDSETWKDMRAVSLAQGTQSGLSLIENTPKEYRGLALQMKMDIEKELDCNTSHEKALVDQVVTAYIKNLSYSWLLSASQDFEFHSKQRNAYFSFLSKECDRAFRQYTSGIETLKRLKQPNINVNLNIKDGNAFIAKNQQFNNKQQENQ